MKDQAGKPSPTEISSFARIILAAFVFGELCTFAIEAVYLAKGESSLAVFFIDTAVFTAILGAISLTCYLLFRKILMRLKDSEAKLAAANEELAGYALTVSHDLKGPVTGIMLSFGAMETVLKGTLDQVARDRLLEIAEVGKRNIENAGRLIDDLLFIAETGAPKEVEPVSLGDKLGEAVEERRAGMNGHGLTVESGDDLGEVLASPIHIYQLFDNLVNNSIKYSGTEDLILRVERLPSEEGVRIAFSDNGSGIPEDLLTRVFDRFVKGTGGDTGLGLSIVEKIVHAYGGEIEASNVGGARFEFTLKDYEERATG